MSRARVYKVVVGVSNHLWPVFIFHLSLQVVLIQLLQSMFLYIKGYLMLTEFSYVCILQGQINNLSDSDFGKEKYRSKQHLQCYSPPCRDFSSANGGGLTSQDTRIPLKRSKSLAETLEKKNPTIWHKGFSYGFHSPYSSADTSFTYFYDWGRH